MKRSLVALTVLTSLTPIASPAATLQSAWFVRDSAGISILEWQGAVEDLPSSGDLEAQAMLTIGRLEGPDHEIFGSIRTGLLTGDHIILVDGQANEIRVFGRDGRHTATVGGTGQGPGEFRIVNGLSHGPDGGLEVYDMRAARLTRFDREWALTGTIPLTLAEARVSRARSRTDGRLSAIVGGSSDGYPVRRSGEHEIRTETSRLATLDPDARELEVIATVPQIEAAFSTGPNGNPVMTLMVLGAEGDIGLLDDGFASVWSREAEVRIWNGAGQLRSITRIPAMRTPLRQEAVDAYRDRVLASSPAAHRSAVAASFSDPVLPEWTPAFNDLTVGGDGSVWISAHPIRNEDGSRRWWRVDVDSGMIDGSVAIPSEYRVLSFGPGGVLVSSESDTGVPRAHLIPFGGGAP